MIANGLVDMYQLFTALYYSFCLLTMFSVFAYLLFLTIKEKDGLKCNKPVFWYLFIYK